MRRLPAVVGVLLAVLLAPGGARAARWKSGRAIGPGPTTLADGERAIVADAAAGTEDAVILVEETEVNEDLDGDVETLFHRRAKILSNEGRELANVELPIGQAKLKQWWGRVLCPDGIVRELPQSQVEQQVLARVGSTRLTTFKAALPGVEPGCVVDYGWVLRGKLFLTERRIPLQGEWLIRDFFYGWRPLSLLQGAYHVRRAESLRVDARVHNQGIVITGGDFRPVLDEPWMPPDPEVRAAVVLYYVPPHTNYARFWDDMARSYDALVEAGRSKKPSIERAFREIGVAKSATVDASVRKLFAWIDANVRNAGLRSFEELQAASGDRESTADPVLELLTTREADNFEIHAFFIALARALGAQAHLVLASDRRLNLWNPTLRSLGQFDATLVAVGPTDGSGSAMVVDPGSGLPYGGIPWWLSGGDALMATPRGAKIIHLKPPTAAESIHEAKVDLRFGDEDLSIRASWTETGSGQVGLDLKRYLRPLAPEERTDRLHELCGSSPDNEVHIAELTGLGRLASPFELRCESEVFDTGLDESIDRYMLEWNGPWIEAFPDLPDELRRHPLVFDFPRVEIVRVSVAAPTRFVPGTPPPPVALTRPYGKYSRKVSVTETGFDVERKLALVEVALPVDQYPAFREFVLEVEREDRAPLVFVRKP